MVRWLSSLGVEDVAMESTGVYWKPVYNVLEAHGLRPLLGNARQMRRVPGRKTDVKDAEWIAELHRLGLVQASNVPSREQRELRELTRYRRSLVQERSRESQRLQKVLEGANVKLASVASDVLGASGRDMLRALIKGEENVESIADLARGRLREKRAELMAALEGLLGPHQRFLLREQLSHIEDLERRIAALDQEVSDRLRPFDELIDRLDEVPGLGRRTLEDILSEIGTDMSRYPSESHLASWAKICPGSHQTGGKQLGAPTGKGNPWLKPALTEAAKSAGRKRGSFFHAKRARLVKRMGANKANVAIAHTLLRLIYRMIKTGATYQELGADYYDERGRDAIKRHLLKRLEKLDFQVDLTDRRALA
jgi:transposase